MRAHRSLPEQLVDLSKLETATGGNTDFMNKMIELFLEDTPPQIDQMNEAVNNNDLDSLSAVAHKIKPSLDMVACEQVGLLVRAVENPKDDTVLEDATLLVTALNRLIDQIKNR